MGGLFSGPVAPVQSNEAQLQMVNEQRKQNDLLYAQQATNRIEQQQSDDAEAENLRMLEIREANADAEKQERGDRMRKGKKDLLYRNALGTNDDNKETGTMFKLGGA